MRDTISFTALLKSIRDSRSLTVSQMTVDQNLQDTELTSSQRQILMKISSLNDLDEIWLIVATELGLTEEVATLKTWLAKKRSRAAREHSMQGEL